MFSFGWLKRIDGLRILAYINEFFYLSTLSRITLLLAVNFQSDALLDLVPFVQFKKREKHPWRRITFSKVSLLLTKSGIPPWVFFTFFKLHKWYQIAQSI